MSDSFKEIKLLQRQRCHPTRSVCAAVSLSMRASAAGAATSLCVAVTDETVAYVSAC